MNYLEKAIAESKEREHRTLFIPYSNPDEIKELVFIIGTLSTWEPRWREMVEVAIKALATYKRYIDCLCEMEDPKYCAEIFEDAYSAKDALDELERLAKEGLESD